MELIHENYWLKIEWDEIAEWIEAEGLTDKFCAHFSKKIEKVRDAYADDFAKFELDWED